MKKVWSPWFIQKYFSAVGVRVLTLVNLSDAVTANTNDCITFVQRRPNVFDVGPTLYKYYTDALCLLRGVLCWLRIGTTLSWVEWSITSVANLKGYWGRWLLGFQLTVRLDNAAEVSLLFKYHWSIHHLKRLDVNISPDERLFKCGERSWVIALSCSLSPVWWPHVPTFCTNGGISTIVFMGCFIWGWT